MTLDIDSIEILFKFNNNVCFPKTEFIKLFEFLKTKPCKKLTNFFTKTVYKEYHKDLVFEQVYDVFKDFFNHKLPSKETVNNYIPVSIDDDNIFYKLLELPQTIVNIYKKKGFSLYSFPSTSDLYESVCEHRITFKINNRIYLNLCKVEYMSELGSVRYFVNIHYHNKENCDVNSDIDLIKEVSNIITSFE
uniref:Uncharacterized protein n=1 Tax=viral metagenome TaxID=1070528 RepID=A0A6C0BQB6_9ZZZZ